MHHLGPGFTNNFLISYRDIDNHLKRLSSVMFWHEVATELGIRNNQVKMLHIANMLGEPKFINRKKKDSLHFLHEKVMELKLWFQTPRAIPTVDLLPIGELLEWYYGYDPQLTYHALQLTDGRVSGSGVAIDFADWPGVSSDVWAQELDLGSMQFAGAGAVGNAALFALQHLTAFSCRRSNKSIFSMVLPGKSLSSTDPLSASPPHC